MNKPITLCTRCIEYARCGLTYDGDKCRRIRTVEPTNADRFRSMTDEEMANEFSGQCPAVFGGTRMSGEDCAGFESCQECWLDWLKQEVM